MLGIGMTRVRTSHAEEIKCTECGRAYGLKQHPYKCENCSAPLEVAYDYSRLRKTMIQKLLDTRAFNHWRYELLPITSEKQIVTLQEGGTPLHIALKLEKMLQLDHVFLKDETGNPTWSFKDRGSTVALSHAKEIGAKYVSCTSSGNMGASMAAYAAKAGLLCLIFLPKYVAREKIVQILATGAKVISLDMPYPAIRKTGFEVGEKYEIYMGGESDAPMRVEGYKTISYEICEQLGWKVPDKVVVPCSSGGLISGIWKGWRELREIGLVNRSPEMVCIQAEGNSPIVRAFREGKDTVQVWERTNTIASAITNPDPPSGQRVLKILKESKGAVETVSDEEILEAQKVLIRQEGLFAEPSSAVTIAGMRKLREKGVIRRGESVVCIITGAGLKDPKSATVKADRPHEFTSSEECIQAVPRLLDLRR